MVRVVAALCLAVAALSACGATPDNGAAVAADEASERSAEQGRKHKEKGPGRSTASDSDLDAYVASAEKAVHQMFGNSFKKLYSKIDIVPVQPNGIEYDYTFRTAVGPAAAKRALDAQAPTLRTQSRTVIIPEMERAGFDDPTVTYTYRNPDGSVVWSRTFS